MYGARHRHDLASLFAGEPRRDQRPGACGCLDDEHAAREPGHEPVAAREVVREWRRAGRELADQRAARRDARGELAVFGRVDAVEPGAADRDRGGPRGERAAVRLSVDARREPARDREARDREPGREIEGGLAPGRRRRAAADDRHLRARQDGRVALDEECGRHARYRGELGRVAGVFRGQERAVRAFEPGEIALDAGRIPVLRVPQAPEPAGEIRRADGLGHPAILRPAGSARFAHFRAIPTHLDAPAAKVRSVPASLPPIAPSK